MNFGRRHKYNVSAPEARTWRERTYASKAEMLYAQLLNLELDDGQLIEIVEQPRIRLGPDFVYVPDFLVIPSGNGEPWYVDVKGVQTPQFRKAKKLWAKYGRLSLCVMKQAGKTKFKRVETIEGGSKPW